LWLAVLVDKDPGEFSSTLRERKSEKSMTLEQTWGFDRDSLPMSNLVFRMRFPDWGVAAAAVDVSVANVAGDAHSSFI
jgi:hypothetical protein